MQVKYLCSCFVSLIKICKSQFSFLLYLSREEIETWKKSTKEGYQATPSMSVNLETALMAVVATRLQESAVLLSDDVHMGRLWASRDKNHIVQNDININKPLPALKMLGLFTGKQTSCKHKQDVCSYGCLTHSIGNVPFSNFCCLFCVWSYF